MKPTHYTFMNRRFTLRQMQVISLYASILQLCEIGGRLKIAEGTVKTHLSNIRMKLGMEEGEGRKLIVDALENGFDSKGNYSGESLQIPVDEKKARDAEQASDEEAAPEQP